MSCGPSVQLMCDSYMQPPQEVLGQCGVWGFICLFLRHGQMKTLDGERASRRGGGCWGLNAYPVSPKSQVETPASSVMASGGEASGRTRGLDEILGCSPRWGEHPPQRGHSPEAAALPGLRAPPPTSHEPSQLAPSPWASSLKTGPCECLLIKPRGNVVFYYSGPGCLRGVFSHCVSSGWCDSTSHYTGMFPLSIDRNGKVSSAISVSDPLASHVPVRQAL